MPDTKPMHERIVGITLAMVLCTVLVSCATVTTPLGPCPRAIVSKWSVRPERLTKQSSFEAADRVLTGHPSAEWPKGTPTQREWENLKAKARPGDQLWAFAAPQKPGLYGALEGVILFRGCSQLAVIATALD